MENIKVLNNHDALCPTKNAILGEEEMPEPIGKIASAFHRYMQIYISRSLVKGRYGIGPGQLYVLLATACNEGLCQKEIAQQLMIEKATVAKAIKTLVKIGYVRTEVDSHDKRHTKIFLSKKGHAIMPSMLLFLDEMNQIILENFTDSEIKMVYHFLERMNRNLLKKLMCVGDKLSEDK